MDRDRKDVTRKLREQIHETQRGVCERYKIRCFKVHNLVSVYPKSIKRGQMTTLQVIFHVVVSDYRLVKL